MSAVVRRYGPRPERRFYQLDEALLRDGSIKPLPKMLLIDFFHRENKGEAVAPIGERALDQNVSYDSLERAEQWLTTHGYLLKRERRGLTSVYLATYPPIPEGDPQRAQYEADLEQLFRDLPQNAGGRVPQNAGGGSRKTREEFPQAAGGSEVDTCTESKKNNLKDSPPPAELALRFYHEVENALTQYHRNPPSFNGSVRDEYLRAFEYHFQEGHVLTLDAVKQAVAAAVRSWQSKGMTGVPRKPDPVLNELASIINPLPESTDGTARETGGRTGSERPGTRSGGGGRAGRVPTPARDRGATDHLLSQWIEEGDQYAPPER